METGGLGDYVRERRKRLGLTQREVAERAGIAQPQVSDIERGVVQFPTADIRRRLAHALGVRHVDIIVAAGELTADEVPNKTSAPPRSEADELLDAMSEEARVLNMDLLRFHAKTYPRTLRRDGLVAQTAE